MRASHATATFTPRLTDEAIDRLDRYLAEHCADPGGLPDCEALDGFLCAVAAAPMLIPPSEWMDVVWGDEHAFPDHGTALELTGLLMRFCQQIVARLGDPAAASEPTDDPIPLFVLPDTDPDDPDRSPDMTSRDQLVGAHWAYGFRLGRELCDEDWEVLTDASPELDESLLAVDSLILELGEPEAEIADDDLPTLGERLGIMAALPALPSMLHALYLDARRQAMPPALPFRRAEPKVGRNDPGPCGSGRKYKGCHDKG